YGMGEAESLSEDMMGGMGGGGGGLGMLGGRSSGRNQRFAQPRPELKRNFAKQQMEQLGRRSLSVVESKRGLSRGRAAGANVYFGANADGLLSQLKAPFQNLDATRQYAESHWDRVRSSGKSAQNAALIGADAFWLAVAMADNEQQLLRGTNTELLRPTGNRHAALAALAFCGLPLKSGEIDLPAPAKENDKGDAKKRMYQPAHSVAVITKRLRTLQPSGQDSSLLVTTRFEPTKTPPRRPNDKTPLTAAPEEFLVNTAYRGQIVLTNPTPQPQTLDVLWQIPSGSLALSGGRATDSKTVTLNAFAVTTIQYQFYFPAAGDFTHYPVCVADDDTAVARGTPRSFNVLDAPTKLDTQSWETLARDGDASAINAFLADANLAELNWSLVAHRMKERPIYDAVLKILDQNQRFVADLYAYAVHHRDADRLATFLDHRVDLTNAVGPVLDSPLLVVRPIERQAYEQLEYAPLVRGRIHALRSQPEILNDRFLNQYRV
ncbi:MAG: hypothetical protein AAFP90_12295, partial [Planctomycetota bacterium]